MLHVFDECASERYQRIPVTTDDQSTIAMQRRIVLNQQTSEIRYSRKQTILFLFRIEGEIIESVEDIIAENVPIITPNGDIIVESLSLKVNILKSKQTNY